MEEKSFHQLFWLQLPHGKVQSEMKWLSHLLALQSIKNTFEWYQFCPHRVHPHELILHTLYFEFAIHLQRIKEREINMFCVVLFLCAHNVVFFLLGKTKINFKHLIALVESVLSVKLIRNGAKPAATTLTLSFISGNHSRAFSQYGLFKTSHQDIDTTICEL